VYFLLQGPPTFFSFVRNNCSQTEPKNFAEEIAMAGCRLNAVGAILCLFVGCVGNFQFASKRDTIEGVWEVHSVCRDGKVDPTQVGAHLSFAKGMVVFQPKVRQFVDGTG